MPKKLILPLSETHRLRKWANDIRGFYGYPVYLVGSQVTDKTDPRDVDVCCIISDEDFERRYGSVDKWIDEGEDGLWTDIRWTWADDCIKKWQLGCDYTKLNLDFKVIPLKHHRKVYFGKPMYQLDTRN